MVTPMSPISRGFRGRRRAEADSAPLPPGQYLTRDFPVLSAGPTPHGSFEGCGDIAERMGSCGDEIVLEWRGTYRVVRSGEDVDSSPERG